LEDTVGGKKIIIRFDKENQSATIFDGSGKVIPSTQAYWFAWSEFYPNTDLYQ